jgi:hypothetical protein
LEFRLRKKPAPICGGFLSSSYTSILETKKTISFIFMYPALEVPSQECWKKSEQSLMKEPVPQMLGVTHRSFLSQLSFVQDFSLKLFNNLSADVSRVHERIKSVGKRIGSFNGKKTAAVRELQSQPVIAFLIFSRDITNDPRKSRPPLNQLLPVVRDGDWKSRAKA